MDHQSGYEGLLFLRNLIVHGQHVEQRSRSTLRIFQARKISTRTYTNAARACCNEATVFLRYEELAWPCLLICFAASIRFVPFSSLG